MANELADRPEYRDTMHHLEKARRVAQSGVEYWFAREIYGLLGYQAWANFVGVIDKAKASFSNNSVDPSHHIVDTRSMMGVGKGAHRSSEDFFLSRAACYLIAMNGESTKPEIAAAQAYFVIKTREKELDEEDDKDAKRLELREKVSQSFRRVSGVAKSAGVPNHLQGVFHDARYRGLYGMTAKMVQAKKGLAPKEQLFDRSGPLELSANDFQMNLAAEVIERERIKGQQPVIKKNEDVAKRVRAAIRESGGTMPENLPLDSPIGEVRKRIRAQKKIATNRTT
ncbi:MAG: DNA damage-inducible protein D [Hyphomicrobiales bacterium]